MASNETVYRSAYPALKRAIDIVVSAVALVILAPVLIVLAAAVKLDSPGPAIFLQQRVGRGGKLFWIKKFRTMVAAAPALGHAVTSSGDSRITRIGAFLRKSKLDELPQLINVLAGEMSLVGPRPEVPQYVAFYSPAQRDLLLSIKPGITDYAALLFHDESEMLKKADDAVEVYRSRIMPIKFAYYEKYISDMSFMTDFRIVLATCSLVLFRKIPDIFPKDIAAPVGD